MAIPLSQRTSRIAEILLQDSDRSRITSRLITETAENIPMWHDFTPEGMERIRFAVLKLIVQNPKNENIAFNHAQMDWRDIFMAAGFAESATEHESWYEALEQTNG